MMKFAKLLRFVAVFIGLATAQIGVAAAQIYSADELEAEAVRLRNAVIRIYNIGIRPSLTDQEVDALDHVEFSFPLPEKGDPLMSFSATTDGRSLILPLMSLKAVEDLTTAYAWLYHNQLSLDTIDLYFAMLRYKSKDEIPGGQFPRILDALGVPKDAYKTDKRVDELSLSLRNEAFAFIIAHELGHILYRHKPLDQISAAQARQDEVQSDFFALDVFRRTGTPPLGPLLFFQAQIYSLVHEVEFGSELQSAPSYARLQMTHPLSVDRIRSMTDYIRGPLLQQRPKEIGIWLDVSDRLQKLIPLMADKETATCFIELAKQSDLSILKPRKGIANLGSIDKCRF